MADPEMRLRRALAGRQRITEKRMFGGICFMLCDHMLCGIGKTGFMFRVGKEQQAETLARPGTTAVEFNGRRMRGFVWVDPAACTDRNLREWIALAETFVATLPPKTTSNKTTSNKTRSK